MPVMMSRATTGSRQPQPPEEPREAVSNLLRMLGNRVRDARARHGMTRRMLARDSHISERYLAELRVDGATCRSFS